MSSDEELACGRTIDSVWLSIGGEPDDHQRRCTHCLDARRRLTRLQAMTLQAQREDAELATRPDVRRRIMDFARSHVRRGERIQVKVVPGTVISLSEHAIAAAVREVVDSHPGLTARRCAVRGLGAAAGGSVPLGLDVGLVIDPLARFGAGEDRLRRHIAHAVSERLGAIVTSVDLTVEDLAHD
ncbi:hypothetical protein [Rothia halotolerans]|uniref:hypothetical protein n=1 Tax=Rothia halotolerans TaxID=405770 RepID=UPI00101D6398|nr:hypothetical protein [Rothia halotolerans]